jgi:glycosyltransferase involved in cell wall biosynthesis
MKIACVSLYDARTNKGWAMRGYHQVQSLKNQGVEIEYFQLSRNLLLSLLVKVKNRYYRLQNQCYVIGRDRFLHRYYDRELTKRLSKTDVDLVFSPIGGPEWQQEPVAYLECDQPIVIWTDATLIGYMNAFGINPPNRYYMKPCKKSVQDGLATERSMLSRCSLILYTSDWAAQSAVKNYSISPAKVKVVPFGPFVESNFTLNDVRKTVNSRPRHECKLLFIGTDWHMKGGDRALNVAKDLNSKGLKTTLTVVGCEPVVKGPLPSFVRPVGFIDTSTRKGLDLIRKLYSESHFLIMPTRCDTFGVVFCEASSFGVPSIATNVGGITTAIKDNLNGKTFPTDASLDDYCDYIINLFSDYSEYKTLALSSFNQYESRLNWSVAGQTVKTLMMQIIKAH